MLAYSRFTIGRHSFHNWTFIHSVVIWVFLTLVSALYKSPWSVRLRESIPVNEYLRISSYTWLNLLEMSSSYRMNGAGFVTNHTVLQYFSPSVTVFSKNSLILEWKWKETQLLILSWSWILIHVEAFVFRLLFHVWI